MMKKIFCILLLLLSLNSLIAQPFQENKRLSDSIETGNISISPFGTWDDGSPEVGSIWIDREKAELTPEELVNEVLLKNDFSNCIIKAVIENVKFEGLGWDQTESRWKTELHKGTNSSTALVESKSGEKAIGYFSNGITNEGSIGMESGVLLTTGAARYAEGPRIRTANLVSLNGGRSAEGANSDSLLQSLVPGKKTITKTILEFDFTPLQDKVSFEYVFASEEYKQTNRRDSITFPNYDKNYVDAFGIFISGPGIEVAPGISGFKNIATINQNEPITVLNINHLINNNLYRNLTDNSLFSEYAGATKVMTAEQGGLKPGEKYHIKFVLGNVGDHAYSTGVFIKAGSFDVGLGIKHEINSTTGSTLYEGCDDGKFILNMTEVATDIDINISCIGTGCADLLRPNGNPFLGTYTVPAGHTSLAIPYKIKSGASGGPITLTAESICGATTAAFNIHKRVDFTLAPTHFCKTGSGELKIDFTPNSPPFEFSMDGGINWTTLSTRSDTVLLGLPAGKYIVYAREKGSCDITNKDSVTILAQPILPTVLPINLCQYKAVPDIKDSVTNFTPDYKMIWFNNAGTRIPVPILNSNVADSTFYWVAFEDSITNCISDSVKIDVTVHEKPVKPIVSNLDICQYASNADITTAITNKDSNYEIIWFSHDGFHVIGEPTINTTLIGSTSYKAAFRNTTSSCEGEISDMITINIIPKPNASDIRVQLCPIPDRDVNLSAYLDTAYLELVSWNSSVLGVALGLDGILKTGHIQDGTYGLQYKVSNQCGDRIAKLYVSSLMSANPSTIKKKKTIVVCKDFAACLHLQQILGIEIDGGIWNHAGSPLSNPSNVLRPYVKEATSAPYAGALIFDGKKAFFDGVGGTPPGSDQVIVLTYTTGSTACLDNEEIELTIRLTDALVD